MYKERKEEERVKYLDILEDISLERLVYIDESGVDHNLIQDKCWSEKGQQIIGERSGSARGRTSIIAALNNGKIKAPMTFRGTADTELFTCWLEQFLVPELKPRQVIIMDNASIHKGNKVREIIENAGCYLIYLPPYSPDFNPIEHYWAALKAFVKKILHKFKKVREAIEYALLNENTTFNAESIS